MKNKKLVSIFGLLITIGILSSIISTGRTLESDNYEIIHYSKEDDNWINNPDGRSNLPNSQFWVSSPNTHILHMVGFTDVYINITMLNEYNYMLIMNGSSFDAVDMILICENTNNFDIDFEIPENGFFSVLIEFPNTVTISFRLMVYKLLPSCEAKCVECPDSSNEETQTIPFVITTIFIGICVLSVIHIISKVKYRKLNS